MVIVHGESNSGKSKKVLSLIDQTKKCLYFALDFDKNIKLLELNNKNLQVTAYPKGTLLVDIEQEILNHGGLFKNKLSYVVIDTINFLKDDKKNLHKLLSRLKKLEMEYNKFEIIAVINTLHSSKLKYDFKIEGVEVIETKKENNKVIYL